VAQARTARALARAARAGAAVVRAPAFAARAQAFAARALARAARALARAARALACAARALAAVVRAPACVARAVRCGACAVGARSCAARVGAAVASARAVRAPAFLRPARGGGPALPGEPEIVYNGRGMRLDPTLSAASRLARSGRYEAALRVLEPQVTHYNRSFHYCYLMGVVYLRSGNVGNALTYLRLARELNGRDVSTILGLAALYLKRGDVGSALDLYLDALELDGKNRVAKKALRVIRRNTGADSLSAWLGAGRLPSLYPPVPFPGLSAREAAAVAGAAVAACAIGFGAFVFAGLVPNPFAPHGPREIPPGLALTREARTAPVAPGGSHLYVFTQSQAVGAYERALVLFTNYRDNAARVYLNRILESNAADVFRDRIGLMLHYMDSPTGFHDFGPDNVSISRAWQEPLLYRGVYVIWRGRATDVDALDRTSFTFLVGDNPDIRLEGVVRVVFSQAVPVPPPGELIEVLGRVVPVEGDGGRIMLEGITIRENL